MLRNCIILEQPSWNRSASWHLMCSRYHKNAFFASTGRRRDVTKPSTVVCDPRLIPSISIRKKRNSEKIFTITTVPIMWSRDTDAADDDWTTLREETPISPGPCFLHFFVSSLRPQFVLLIIVHFSSCSRYSVISLIGTQSRPLLSTWNNIQFTQNRPNFTSFKDVPLGRWAIRWQLEMVAIKAHYYWWSRKRVNDLYPLIIRVDLSFVITNCKKRSDATCVFGNRHKMSLQTVLNSM